MELRVSNICAFHGHQIHKITAYITPGERIQDSLPQHLISNFHLGWMSANLKSCTGFLAATVNNPHRKTPRVFTTS